MVATRSPRRDSRSHLDLTPREFERRLAAHGHAGEEIERLWDELAGTTSPAAAPTASRALALGPLIAVYLGLLFVVAASAALVGLYWHDLGAGGVLTLALVYLAGSLTASEVLRRRGLVEPADVLEAVAVGWIGLATYAVQELAGVWPEGASESSEIHRGLTTIAIVGLAAAAVLLALRPDPLLLVPMAAATALLAVDLAELVYGKQVDALSGRQVTTFVLPLGLAWIAAGFWLDVIRRRGYAMWAHWCGLLLTGVAVTSMIPQTVPGFALLIALAALALFLSAFVHHWSFTVVGAVGVLRATVGLMAQLHRLGPLVIAVAGLGLIYVGLRWSRWQETIRAAALARMPTAVRDFVTRLAP